MSQDRKAPNHVQKLDLEKQFKNLLEEARTVMPGIQALFGFQLIAVFQQAFTERLTASEQAWHLVATGLSALAAGLVMCPAALQRQASPDQVSSRLAKISTVAVASGLAPLSLAISIDFWLLAHMVLHDWKLPTILGIVLYGILLLLWYGLPYSLKRTLAEPDEGDREHHAGPVSQGAHSQGS